MEQRRRAGGLGGRREGRRREGREEEEVVGEPGSSLPRRHVCWHLGLVFGFSCPH